MEINILLRTEINGLVKEIADEEETGAKYACKIP